MNYADAPALYRKLAAFLIILLFIASGCKKDDPVEPISPTRRLLTRTSWQITKALDVGSSPGAPVDITLQMPMGYVAFNTDGTFSSASIGGTWEFTESESKILIHSSSFESPIAVYIEELTETVLQLRMMFTFPDQPRLLVVTFASFTPDFSPEVNFETIWKEFDTRYSFFEVKKINWDSVYSVYRPQVKKNTTDAELFQIMSSMLNIFKDGHVNLYTPHGTFAYSGWYTKYPANFISKEAVTKYLSSDYGTLANGYLRYGKINDNIGYIYIGPNLMGNNDDWTLAIDRIIDSLKNTKGIVIDIRNNGGGSDGLGMIVASRFCDRQRTYSHISWRSGPRHADFTQAEPSTVQPDGKQQYLKPVALLTNRHCFSSAEGTILMLRVLPNVVTIGDTTGGGSGNPITLQLPNGWSYRLSRWIQYTADMEVFEGKGLAPAIPVGISEADYNAGKDAILEYAVSYLTNK
ncbi:MAG: S41 family peptidase [Syntrophomonadaceae bacterium]